MKNGPNRDKLTEVYVDDNADITFVVHRLSLLLRKMKRNHERVVIQILAEEVITLDVTKKRGQK